MLSISLNCFNVNVFANNEDYIYTKDYIIQDLNLNSINYYSENIDFKNNLIQEYDILPETAQTIQNILSNPLNKNISAIEIIKPNINKNTYSGRFYEEIIKVEANSDEAKIEENVTENYVNKILSVTVNFTFDSIINSKTAGMWSLARSLGEAFESVPSTTSITHAARLYEDKYCKHTYVVEDGQYYFGALTEKSHGRFQDYFVYPGFNGGIEEGKNPQIMDPVETDSFRNPEERAEVSYLNGGWVEHIYEYEYEGVSFDSVSAS